jgi:hypothetical protein
MQGFPHPRYCATNTSTLSDCVQTRAGLQFDAKTSRFTSHTNTHVPGLPHSAKSGSKPSAHPTGLLVTCKCPSRHTRYRQTGHTERTLTHVRRQRSGRSISPPIPPCRQYHAPRGSGNRCPGYWIQPCRWVSWRRLGCGWGQRGLTTPEEAGDIWRWLYGFISDL